MLERRPQLQPVQSYTWLQPKNLRHTPPSSSLSGRGPQVYAEGGCGRLWRPDQAPSQASFVKLLPELAKSAIT